MISKDKTKLIFVIPKELKEKIEKESEKQNRSMANLIVTILKDYFEKKGSE